MSKWIKLLWYLGAIAAAVTLVVAFLYKSWPFTIASLVLGLLLKRTNRYIELAPVYQELGVKNEVFEGTVKNEKNNQ